MLPIYLSCFKRDGHKCRHCNGRNGVHPHHVIYRSQGGKDELSNLLTLCACCHRAVHDHKLLITVEGILENNLRVRFTRVKNWKPC
jgi:5-methylcytosine-specific restriction endonuclease McrA